MLVVAALLNSPLADRAPLLIQTLYQGSSTSLAGYKIRTGFDYLYHHDQFPGRVSLTRIAPGYKNIDWNFYLIFEQGAKDKVEEIRKMCERPISNCERLSQEKYVGFNLATYIEVNDEIINQTIYFNPKCDVYIYHLGVPFDHRYLDAVERFFDDNCPTTGS